MSRSQTPRLPMEYRKARWRVETLHYRNVSNPIEIAADQ